MSEDNSNTHEKKQIVTMEEMRKHLRTNGVIVTRRRPFASKSRVHSTYCPSLKYKYFLLSTSKQRAPEYWWFASLDKINKAWHDYNLSLIRDINEYICKMCAKRLKNEL